jgi:hypothetical protein
MPEEQDHDNFRPPSRMDAHIHPCDIDPTGANAACLVVPKRGDLAAEEGSWRPVLENP